MSTLKFNFLKINKDFSNGEKYLHSRRLSELLNTPVECPDGESFKLPVYGATLEIKRNSYVLPHQTNYVNLSNGTKAVLVITPGDKSLTPIAIGHELGQQIIHEYLNRDKYIENFEDWADKEGPEELKELLEYVEVFNVYPYKNGSRMWYALDEGNVERFKTMPNEF